MESSREHTLGAQDRSQTIRRAARAAVSRTVASRSFLGLKPNDRSMLALDNPVTEGAVAAHALHYRSPYARAWRELRGLDTNY